MLDVVIIGAGPAGLMAAIVASQNNKVLVIEKNKTSGNKLLITGGGRCNLTNLKDNNTFLNEVKHNRKYLYSAINKFGPQMIYDFFCHDGVKLKEEEDNKIFPCSEKASDILKTLINRASKASFKYNETVQEIKINDTFITIITSKAEYITRNVIIATGGSSFKNTGSSGDNLKFANMINQPVIDIYPAEVGVKLIEVLNLAGTSIDNVKIYYLKYKTEGNLIFTHKGLSGSAIMRMSEYIYNNNLKEIKIDLLPTKTYEELLNMLNNFDRDKELGTFLNMLFSKRFSNYLTIKLGMNSNTKIKNLNNKDIHKILSLIKGCKFIIKEVGSIDESYVTGGGIDMKYINSTSMESRINKHVYFAGEALDIHGPIGGYNITLALATGYLAGSSINKS